MDNITAFLLVWTLTIIFIVFVILWILVKVFGFISKIRDLKEADITSKDLFEYYKRRALETEEERRERWKRQIM